MKRFSYPLDSTSINKILNERKYDFMDERTEYVEDIIKNVKNNGDSAVIKYTRKFDGVTLDNLSVSSKEITDAYQVVDDQYLASLRKSINNVTSFHRKQLRNNWFDSSNGGITGQLINPLARIGAYVPGGRAAYPSSVVMTVIPAKVAGVKEVVMVSPVDSDGTINPYTLVAAREAGADEIYKAGGAQAVAALAFGTESIKAVDKIVGPGNIYVTLAKKLVYGAVDIDMLAGPSEVLILADESANPDFIAADMLSQAEHDPLSVSILITNSQKIADETNTAVNKQLNQLSRKEIARTAIDDNGLIILIDDIISGIELVNQFAPEHFELVVNEPFKYLNRIKNAGAIFIGEYSSEPLGDYLAGPNHVLPTGGTARYASPLNTDDFVKKSSIIYYQQQDLKMVKDDVIRLAELEGLTAHSGAIKKRFL